MTRLITLCVLAIFAIGLPGCGNLSSSNPSQQSSDATFTGGKLHGQLKGTLPKAMEASRTAAEDMKLKVVAFSSDASAGRVVAVSPDYVRIEMEIRPKTEGCQITISNNRDHAGNDQAMVELYNRIRARM